MKYLAPALLLLTAATQANVTNQIDWQWDRDTPICALRLEMTPSGGMIEISRTPGNEETEIKLTVQPQPGVREGHVPDGAFKLNSGGEVIAHVSQHVDDEKQLQIYGVTQDPTFITKFSNASSLEIPNRRGGSFQVALRSAAAAVEALRNCEDRKMREWGIDPVAWRGLRTRPIPLKPVRDRFSALDYPREALAAGVEADAIIRLDVGLDGRVKRCESLNDRQYGGFERASCNILKGARFQAAQDSSGNTVAAPYMFDVRFRIDQ